MICHADLHPANLIRDHAGHVFVIDWEDVMLAPKERDFIFVREAQADGSTLQGIPPFFQGYGHTEIDWIALTYYQRVVQDLIECAQNVFFKDDLGEESRVDEAQLFHNILSEGGNIQAAYAAAAHTPLDLMVNDPKCEQF
ncbi:MAG TPA: phosphotransferase [Ktedonobacteraceae bacterium]